VGEQKDFTTVHCTDGRAEDIPQYSVSSGSIVDQDYDNYMKNSEGSIQVQSWPHCIVHVLFYDHQNVLWVNFLLLSLKIPNSHIAHRQNSVGTDSTITFHIGLSLLC